MSSLKHVSSGSSLGTSGSLRSRVFCRTRLIAVGMSLVLALGGCSSSLGGPGQSGKGGLGKPAEPPKITQTEAFQHPTDVEVPGLTGQRVVNSTGSEARWSYLPGEQPFNDALAEIVGSYLDAQAASRDQAYEPQVDIMNDPLNRGCVAGSTALTGREILDDTKLTQNLGSEVSLTVVCDAILAAGTTFGERLRFVRGNAQEVTSDAVEIIYTDTATGDVARGRELFSESSLPVLYNALFEVLKIQQPMSGDQIIPPSADTLADLEASLSNIGFERNGDILLTVDRSFIAVVTAGTPHYTPEATTLRVPAARAEEMLVPLGQAISKAQAEQAPWSGPAPVPSGKEFVDCDLVPCAAVTYDDGPSYLTPQVLDVYKERPNAAVTFFVLGQNIEGNEEILKRAAAEGQEIANHSWNHPPLTTLSDEGVAQQVNDTSAKITEVTGEEVTLLRPPYGDLNDRTLAAGGLPAILWSVDTNDWQKPGRDVLVARAVTEVEPDGIVLMHDIHEETVAAAAEIADGLLARGYTLVTVSQLFRGADMQPRAYWNAVDERP